MSAGLCITVLENQIIKIGNVEVIIRFRPRDHKRVKMYIKAPEDTQIVRTNILFTKDGIEIIEKEK